MAAEDQRQNLMQSPARFQHAAKQKIGAATDDADVSFGRILPTHRGLRRDGLRSGTAGPSRPAQKWISVSPLNCCRAQRTRVTKLAPAGAPRCPPEPARRGINRLDVGRPCVTRSSTHAMPKTVAALPTSSSDASSSFSPLLSSLFSSSPLLPS